MQVHSAYRPQGAVVDFYQNADARPCAVDFDVFTRYMGFAIAAGAIEIDNTD